MSSETWCIDTGEVVHKVTAVRRGAGWVAVSNFGHTVLCSSPRLAVEAYASCNSLIGMILAHGEPTRAEMAAQVDALRAQQEPLVACVDALRAAASDSGWRDALATGEHLVAWVRRGALREALAVARVEPGVPDGATQADFNAVECARRIADGIEKLMGGE